VNSTQKGLDPREFALLAFGGAGPLHAVALAEELSMRRVIVPPYCSTFSAFGAVASPVRHDYVQTVALGQAAATPARLEAGFAALDERARRTLAEERVAADSVRLERAADLRYEGQSYELTIALRAADR
jgi:N-methylhydantoinase A